ncbi:endoglucanase [Pseudobutyrivibrio sp. ACV-2]|uniref:glycoside hydrolase family 5 protein n=1 Tax=Pseudobutyrivibrio sp. ACV-2 TaxID=1520801 RepID=UPI00089982F5|nr:glycoside hydrolase family 5 protein [Pseudobutyrivibrio sp. ACV-2]SEA31653.1 endoglucanase [Pseudobutyrivibrio sp. ACV-2]
MVSKKQRALTVFLIFILAAAIVGGVFAISYFKGGVTFPWQLAQSESVAEQATEEPPASEPKLVITEKEKKLDEAKKSVEAKVEDEEAVQLETTEEETSDEATEAVSLTNSVKLKYYGKLSVDGSQLVDEKGNPALLMGVSTHGINWFPEFASKDTIKSLRDTWGINVIRLAMYTSDYNGYCVGGQDNQDKLKGIIDEAVAAATENDMYVIIDWHILNDNDPNEYKSEAIQFFGEMVRKYESNDNVIYEICNEPNGDTTWADIRKYANEVIPVIRNVDEDAVILVGTPEWSSDLESPLNRPLNFDNIMYTYHFYAGTHHSAERSELMDALEQELPVFISEYGLVNDDGNGDVDIDEADEWLGLIREYGLSSCIWNLSNKDEGSALIDADCSKTADFSIDDVSDEGMRFLEAVANYKNTSVQEGVSVEKESIKTDRQNDTDSEDEISIEETQDIEEEILEESEKEDEAKASKSKTSKKDKESTSNSKSKNKSKNSNR